MKKQIHHDYFSTRSRDMNAVCYLCIAFFVMFTINSHAQSYFIRGIVKTSTSPVRYASISFIDNNDTTRKYLAVTRYTGSYTIDISTSMKSNNYQEKHFILEQNCPNPFSTHTAIQYKLNQRSEVKVTIYNILGKKIKQFDVGVQPTGTHSVIWDGTNTSGEKVAKGIYFYQLQASGEVRVRKIIFSKGEGSYIVSSPKFPSLVKLDVNQGFNGSLQERNFTVKIDNNQNTYPVIVPAQFEHIILQSDTTLNFTIDAFIDTVKVLLNNTHQIIRGFGAANILQWQPDMTNSEIETAFGTGEGQLGFSILRLRLQPQKYLWSTNVPTAKKAHDMGVLVFASPWNAPSEMLETVNGQRRVRYDMYDEYAAHLDSFNTFMTSNGVPMYAVSVQNEPDYANDWTGWTANEMLTFMKENASVIGTRVMAPESFQFRHEMSDPILNDPLACANLDIVGGHIYGGGLAPYPLAESKGKEVWMTEHLSGRESNANNWSWALDVATEINSVMNAGMNAYVWWYIVRYYGPISDGTNDSGRKGEVTKKGYVMSQFARFIRPGFFRVEATENPQVKVFISAYKHDSKVVVVVINLNSNPVNPTFEIKNGTVTTGIPYVTSEEKNCVQGDDIPISNNLLNTALEQSSITTFVLE